MVAKEFELLDGFDLSRQEWFVQERFGQGMKIVERLVERLRKMKVEASSHAVMSLMFDESLFKLTFHQKRRANKRKTAKPTMKVESLDQFQMKNFTSLYNREKPDRSGRLFDHIQISALRVSALHRLQSEVLGYTFKNQLILDCALLYVSDRKDFERLEYTGDILVDIFAKLVARRALLYLRREVSNQVSEKVRRLVLSSEGLAFLAVYHKLHHYIDPKGVAVQTQESIAKYAGSVRYGLQCRALYQSCAVAPPKLLADVFEALVGAVFVDGGWQTLFEVLHRLMGPLIVYLCLHAEMVGDELVNSGESIGRKR